MLIKLNLLLTRSVLTLKQTKRIVVDLDKRLHRRFSLALKELGSKKNWTLTKMIEDFVLNAEANPKHFSWLKRQRGEELSRE